MKTHDEVVALFRDKYAYLKAVCQDQIEPFNASAIHQNPDGGWQLNLDQPGTDYKAAITLRPNDEVPHETHGAIGARWFKEGGAFDKNFIPGWLGYPVKDEEKMGDAPLSLPSLPYCNTQLWNSQSVDGSRAYSQFEFGRIDWREGITWDRAVENLNYAAFRARLLEYESMKEHWYWPRVCFGSNEPAPPQSLIYLRDVEHLTGANLRTFFCSYRDAHHEGYYYDDFAISPSLSVTLNEEGKRHVPKDIENAVEAILNIRGIHVVGKCSWSCDLQYSYGPDWLFSAEVEEFDQFTISVWRDKTDIHATINARSKPGPFGRSKTIDKKFTLRNCFWSP